MTNGVLTTFATSGLVADEQVPTDGTIGVRVDVVNTGAREGVHVVQLYARDLVASVVRPVAQLVAYQRVTLAPGERASVAFRVPTTRLAFSDRSMTRVVEPGEIELWVAESAGAKTDTVVAEGIAAVAEAGCSAGDDRVERVRVTLTGGVYAVHAEDARLATATVAAEGR